MTAVSAVIQTLPVLTIASQVFIVLLILGLLFRGRGFFGILLKPVGENALLLAFVFALAATFEIGRAHV